VLDAYAASPLALAHDGYATSGARLLGSTSLRFALHGWQRLKDCACCLTCVWLRPCHSPIAMTGRGERCPRVAECSSRLSAHLQYRVSDGFASEPPASSSSSISGFNILPMSSSRISAANMPRPYNCPTCSSWNGSASFTDTDSFHLYAKKWLVVRTIAMQVNSQVFQTQSYLTITIQAQQASVDTFMNHVLQQTDHRLLLVTDILDNLSRSCGEALIAPE
jgi:hypothetical protein